MCHSESRRVSKNHQKIKMFLSLFLQQILAAKGTLESSILYVGDSNMSSLVSDKSACLILVISERDKDEKSRTLTDFISAGETLGSRCYFGIMNGERNYKFSKSNNIREECMYFFLRYGVVVSSVSGKKSSEFLIDYTMAKTGIPFKTFDDYIVAQNFIESNDNSLILFTTSLSGKIFENFRSLAYELRDNISFGICPDEDLSYEMDVDDLPCMVLYRNQDHAKIFYPDDIYNSKVDDIKSWAVYNMKPLFVPFKLNKQKTYIGKKPVILFFSPVNIEEKKKNYEFISKLAKQYGQDLEFTEIDAVTGNRFMTSLGFSRYADPAVAILEYKGKTPKKYLYDEEADWTHEAVSEFIMNFLDRKLKPLVKSSTLPEVNNGTIKEVNAYTLEETIEEEKDVLMLYYEPWDRVYNEFFPVIENISQTYKGKVIFAKINVAENDLIAGAKPKETPSLVLYTKENEAIKYKGNFKRNDIIAFLSDEADIINEL